MAGDVRLHRVEHFQPDLDQVVEDGRDGAIAVIREDDIGVDRLHLGEDLAEARLEDAAPQPGRDHHAVLRAEVVAGPDRIHAERHQLLADADAERHALVEQQFDIRLAADQVYHELLQPDHVPGHLEHRQLDVANGEEVRAEAGDVAFGIVHAAGGVGVGEGEAGDFIG